MWFQVLRHLSLNLHHLIERDPEGIQSVRIIDLATHLPSSLETLRVIGSVGWYYKMTVALVLNTVAKLVRQRAQRFPHLRAICIARMLSPWCDPKPWDTAPKEMKMLHEVCEANGIALNIVAEMLPGQSLRRRYHPCAFRCSFLSICPVLGGWRDRLD